VHSTPRFLSALHLACTLTIANAALPAAATPDTPAATTQPAAPTTALGRARATFHTTVSLPPSGVPRPRKDPTGTFSLVTYPSPVGPLPAYLTKDPKDGKKHPAIVWITGGDFTSIDDVWTPGKRDNDQSAASYRKAGIVTMFPSLRGGNDNPGHREAFYSEVDDILAAADFLAKQPWVDPTHIYLGGHSTGGTIALLTAEQTARFRAVFAFGPVHVAWNYGPDFVGVDLKKLPDRREDELRAPWRWLADVSRRTFVIEGTGGNIEPLRFMAAQNKNAQIRFVEIPGATHFNALAAANDAIAQKILADGAGATSTIELIGDEITAKMK
jgi:pimeloyl-ACP methyl ester carboxylesterase